MKLVPEDLSFFIEQLGKTPFIIVYLFLNGSTTFSMYILTDKILLEASNSLPRSWDSNNINVDVIERVIYI